MPQRRPLVINPTRVVEIAAGDTLHPSTLATGTRDGTKFLRDDGSYQPAYDSGALHTTGDETATGVKTFAHANITELSLFGTAGPGAISLTGNVNDHNPTDWADKTAFIITSTVDASITGLAALATDGALRVLTNESGKTITLPINSASSSANNRFYGSGSIVLRDKDSVILMQTVRGAGSGWYPLQQTANVAGGIQCTFGDGIHVIPIGTLVCDRIPYNFAPTGWSAQATPSETGSIQFGVWANASAPPTISDSIVAALPPKIVSSNEGASTTLTGWTSSIAAGSRVICIVDANTNLRRASLVIYGTKS